MNIVKKSSKLTKKFCIKTFENIKLFTMSDIGKEIYISLRDNKDQWRCDYLTMTNVKTKIILQVDCGIYKTLGIHGYDYSFNPIEAMIILKKAIRLGEDIKSSHKKKRMKSLLEQLKKGNDKNENR